MSITLKSFCSYGVVMFLPSSVSSRPDQHIGFSFISVKVDSPVTVLSISHLIVVSKKLVYTSILQNGEKLNF